MQIMRLSGSVFDANQQEDQLTSHHRILLIDDNKDAADVLAEILTYHGNFVTTVYDPAAALRVVKDIQPDIILTDIGLPVIDGYELAKLLLDELKDLKTPRIFAISGFGQLVDKKRSKQAGFEGHFVKPFILKWCWQRWKRADLTARLNSFSHDRYGSPHL